jgi:hypothetical protein
VNTVVKIVASWAVPLVVIGAYLGLILTMDTSVTIAMFVLLGGLIVLVLWFLFRELAAHAAISRSIAVGEPDDVVSRARSAIDHRISRRGQTPFRIYEAIGLGLRGQWAESLASIPALDAKVAERWRLLAAATRIAAATELGDPTIARRAMEEIPPLARRLGPSADVVVRECQARVRFVEGDHAGARPLFAALAEDVRLGPAPRAAALYYSARCEDDPARARTFLERARGLAPKTWVKPAAEERLASLGAYR